MRPGAASVVLRWKNSGTISTMPPTATVSRISTIIRKLLVSRRSWLKVLMGVSLLMVSSRLQAVARGARIAGAVLGLLRTVITTFQAISNMPLR